MDPANHVIQDALKSFLAEDLGHGDITTEALVDPRIMATGQVTCNEPAVIAGLEEAETLLRMVGCDVVSRVRDGEKVPAKTIILQAKGPAHSLLEVERTLLNLLSHMSGVATATAELVQLANKSRPTLRVACTRKTLPGLRYFEKRAVQLGGGDTHRLRLDDAILIKDNHLAIAGSLTDSIKRARTEASFTKKIEVEVTKPEDAIEAAEAGSDIILLDNMNPEAIRKAVTRLETKKLRSRVLLEASGGITKENFSAYAKSGVDVISVGRITHSVKSIDMSLELSKSTGIRKPS